MLVEVLPEDRSAAGVGDRRLQFEELGPLGNYA